MKRNLILLGIILVCAIILTFISAQKNNAALNAVRDNFGVYGGKELGENKYTNVSDVRELNLENSQKCSTFSSKEECEDNKVCNWNEEVKDEEFCIEKDIFEAYIVPILVVLDIKYQADELPDSDPVEIGDYKYFEYGLTLECTFENFTNFIIELEKSDKFFVIEHISLKNEGFQDREYSSDKKFTIKIRAVELNKKSKKGKSKK